MTEAKKLNDPEVQQFLDARPWRRLAVDVMREQVLEGRLASYSRIAELVEQKLGYNPGSRNIAWLRKKLYWVLSHETDEVPLHRIAKCGDVKSLADSKETRATNNEKRGREGSLANPQWL